MLAFFKKVNVVSVVPAEWSLRRRVVVAGSLLGALAVGAAAGAGSPLFVYEQSRWHFPDWMLTALFAVYALSLLGTLVVAGSLSDHVGRRPVLTGALLVMLAASVLYLSAGDAVSLLAARALHGVATGAALSTFTAFVAESVPAVSRGTYTQLAGTVPIGGLALGVLVGGFAVSTSDTPVHAVFIPLVLVYVLAIAATLAAPETVSYVPGAVRSLVPRVALPAPLRADFRRFVPLVAATWMTTGLFLGLVPAVNRSVFGIVPGVASALVVFLQPASAAITGIVASRIAAGRAVLLGASGLTIGALTVLAGVAGRHLPLLIIGAVLGGIGNGAGFAAVLRLLSPRAALHERAGLVAAVFVVAYLSFGVPVLISGAALGRWGFGSTVVVYCLLLAVLGTVSTVTLLVRNRPTPTIQPATAGRPVPVTRPCGGGNA